MTLLAVTDLTVTLRGASRLAGVGFGLEAGEIMGLVGESGSGKSLTALALAGLLPPGASASGSVRFEEEELLGADDAALCRIRGRRLGLVFQEPATALNPLQPIGAQVAETLRVHAAASPSEARRRAREVLARVGLPAARVGPDRYPHELSGGQRQRVALALAVALTPRLLIADEPTTALDVTTQSQILALLRRLADEDGMAVILISHDLAVVASLAQRIAILRDGRLLEQGPTAAVLTSPQHEYTRTLLRDFAPSAARHPPLRRGGAPLLEADAVVRSYRGRRTGFFARPELTRAVDGVSFAIAAGERVGLVGESGSGKSTLVRTLLGLEAPDEGAVRVVSEPLIGAPRAVRRRLRRVVQVVFQDPYGSLDPRHSVGRIVAEPLHLLDAPPSPAERARLVAAALADVGLAAAAAGRLPHEFSGGERQRIAIARALVVEPRVLVLDEAVSALDASLRSQILALLSGLWTTRGLAYLFVSHDLAVVRAVTDRTLVMQAGRIVEEGPTEDVLDRPRHPYTRELIAATPTLESALAAQRRPETWR